MTYYRSTELQNYASPQVDPPLNIPLQPVKFDVPVAASFWETGAHLPPPATQERSTRLRLYKSLFDGDFGGIVYGFHVQANYFRRTAVFLADLMMAFPPTLAGAPSDITPTLEEQLIEAVHTAIIDMSRYGVGLLRARAEGPLPIVESADPLAWYPGPRYEYDSLAFEVPGTQPQEGGGDPPRPQDGDQLVVDVIEPQVVSRLTFALQGLTLGALLGVERMPGLGERGVIPCPRQPRDGQWGTSVYPDMVPLVAELCRRYSKVSEALDRHLDPILMLRRDPTAPPSLDSGTESSAITLSLERYRLGDWRAHPVGVLPEDYADAQYVSWDPQMLGNFSQVEAIENSLFSATGIPAALYGMIRGGTINSGVAMRRLYTPTYVYVHVVQSQLKPKIARAARLALRAAGRDVGDIEVDWENPFDVLDRESGTGMDVTSEQPAEGGEVGDE